MTWSEVMPTRNAGGARRAQTFAPIALSLLLLGGGASWATDTDCSGSGTKDASGYYCSSPVPNMIPDLSSDASATTIGSGPSTAWKPSGCTGDDCYRTVTNIGGSFTWYGTAYSSAIINSNGYVTFGTPTTLEASAVAIPDSNAPNNVIYAYGDDLDPSAGGNVKYRATSCLVDRGGAVGNDTCFVVQWNNVPTFDGTVTVTVQLALDLDTNEALIEIESETDGGSGDAAFHPNALGSENSAGSVGLWYKAAGDPSSTGATTGDRFSITLADTVPPGNITKLTSTSGDLFVTEEWVNPANADFAGVLVLAQVGTAVTDTPTNGTTYNVGDSIGTAIVACVSSAGDTTCTDSLVSNGSTYFYKSFAFDNDHNYASGVTISGLPRATTIYKWAFGTGNSTLAAPGVVAESYVVSVGNDRLLHRVDTSDGTRAPWTPLLLGGAVQARPMAGDLDPDADGTTDFTVFISAQNGTLYRYSLDDGTATVEASRNVAGTGGDASCTGGLLQAGPVAMLDDYDGNSNNNDNGVIVATRCGATNNKVLLYNLALSAAPVATFSDAGGNGQLGISNAAPQILYRNGANNLVYVPVRDDGGESLVVLEVNSTPAFADPPYAKLTGLGDIDVTPELFGEVTGDPWLAVGNTSGDVYLFLAATPDGSGGLVQQDSCTVASGCADSDGAVRGLAASGRIGVGPGLFEFWLTWSTDSLVHGIKVGADGHFDEATYWTAAITSPSKPLVLRFVRAAGDTLVYVGSGDGKLYELNATNGAVSRTFNVELGTTIGDPTFDYNNGSNQGIVVGTTGGKIHWVRIN